MFNVNNKDTRPTPLLGSSVSIVNFEQVNADLVMVSPNGNKTFSRQIILTIKVIWMSFSISLIDILFS